MSLVHSSRGSFVYSVTGINKTSLTAGMVPLRGCPACSGHADRGSVAFVVVRLSVVSAGGVRSLTSSFEECPCAASTATSFAAVVSMSWCWVSSLVIEETFCGCR